MPYNTPRAGNETRRRAARDSKVDKLAASVMTIRQGDNIVRAPAELLHYISFPARRGGGVVADSRPPLSPPRSFSTSPPSFSPLHPPWDSSSSRLLLIRTLPLCAVRTPKQKHNGARARARVCVDVCACVCAGVTNALPRDPLIAGDRFISGALLNPLEWIDSPDSGGSRRCCCGRGLREKPIRKCAQA